MYKSHINKIPPPSCLDKGCHGIYIHPRNPVNNKKYDALAPYFSEISVRKQSNFENDVRKSF